MQLPVPSAAFRARQFSFAAFSNRRFLFRPRQRDFVVGMADPIHAGGIRGTHAEEYSAATGSERGFDACIRGWFGNRGGAVIHFAPPIRTPAQGDNVIAAAYENALACLRLFVANGAPPTTIVRGFPGAWEQPISAIADLQRGFPGGWEQPDPPSPAAGRGFPGGWGPAPARRPSRRLAAKP